MASFGDYNRVNTNVTAMDAQLSLNKINRDLGDSRLKLSTGFKINNAEDDAAGFAIATKLKKPSCRSRASTTECRGCEVHA